jgi:cytochrome c oxidase cbb3-type subunit 4
MTDYAILGSITTVLAFATFIGIVAWAYSRRRGAAFRAAAFEPFALPDEAGAQSSPVDRQEQQ